jgi:hypothetical protein
VQALPHAPQLVDVVFRSRHKVPHLVREPAQALPQTPRAHTSPAPQVLPQVPQFWASFITSVQAPPQLMLPAPQAHVPFWQTSRVAQTLPHAPQLATSRLKLRQVVVPPEVQAVVPAAQAPLPPTGKFPPLLAPPEAAATPPAAAATPPAALELVPPESGVLPIWPPVALALPPCPTAVGAAPPLPSLGVPPPA